MPRKGKRRKAGKGIYQDGANGPYEIRVIVGGHAYYGRMPSDSTPAELKACRARLEAKGRGETPRTERGTLAADAQRYIKLIKHLESWKDRQAHLAAWCKRLGDVRRHRISHADVLAARVAWLTEKKPLSPKTVNHRVATLRHLYRTLDGKSARTPCDDVTPLDVPKTPIHRISNELILKVDHTLQEMESRPNCPPWNAKTRARFRVLVSTGKRPIEVMRAVRGDVNLDQRVWVPRDAKGGFCPGVYLNDDMLEAWKLFIAEEAWGTYSSGQFAETIRKAGWPAGVRPYMARHTTWITASELGIDLQDIAIGAGHTDPRMTRKAYVPVLNSRLQKMSEALDGRFGGWKVEANRGTSETKP